MAITETSMHQQWQIKARATSTKAKPHQLWPLFTDFFNLNKWLPTLPTCYGVHGINGEPGCIRYCSGSSTLSRISDVSWSKERLTAVDHVQRCLTYEIVDCNIGFKSYVSTVKIDPVEQSGSLIEWSVLVDPVDGWIIGDLADKYEVALQVIAKTMEDFIAANKTEKSEPKWEGKATVELKSLTADQVWPAIADFCNLQKWFPNLETCRQVDGELGKPGLVRYCASMPLPSADGSGDTVVNWAKEKVVMMDPVERCLRYEVAENNMGLKSYLATFRVCELGEGGCKIEWSFICDPVDGTRLEDFQAYLQSVLHFMANRIEQHHSV